MFFESALQGKTQFWRYLVLFLAAFLASNTIGAIPLLIVIAAAMAKDPGILENAGTNIADLSVYGIEPNVGLLLMIFPFVIGLLAVFLLIKPLNSRSFTSVINGTGAIRWKRFFTSFGIWAMIMAIYLFISLKLDPSNFTLNNTSVSLLLLAFISVCLVPFQTTFEEVLFRGYLMQGIGSWTRSKWMPLVITSLLFALMHSFNPEVKEFGFLLMLPQYLIFGLVFGIITVVDDGIELAMGAHAANNVFLSIFLTQKASALQTAALYEQQEVFPLADLVSLAVIGFLFVILLSVLYKWNWKDMFKYKKEAGVQRPEVVDRQIP